MELIIINFFLEWGYFPVFILMWENITLDSICIRYRTCLKTQVNTCQNECNRMRFSIFKKKWLRYLISLGLTYTGKCELNSTVYVCNYEEEKSNVCRYSRFPESSN